MSRAATKLEIPPAASGGSAPLEPRAAQSGWRSRCRAASSALHSPLLPLATLIALWALAGPSKADELDDRRVEIEHMTPLERQHLRRSEQRFAKFPAADQHRMLALDEALESDPREEELRRVMVRYHEWLDTLSLSARAELLELPADERIAKIRELKAEQAAARKRELEQAPTEADLNAILAWMDDYAWQHRQALLEGLSPARQKYLSGLDDARLRRAMLWLLVHHWHWGKGAGPQISPAEIAELEARFSPGAQHRLAGAQLPADKVKLVGEWVQMAMRHRLETGTIRKMFPQVEAQELQRFLREELSPEQRETLLALTRDQRHRLLLRLYVQSPQRLAQLRPGQPGWPAPASDDGSRPGGPKKDADPGLRPKAGKRAKAAA